MSTPMMKAVRVHTFGDPDVLTYEDLPRPEPGPDEVLVRVHAAGLNPPDWYARRGFANIPEPLRPVVALPFTPGSDISGVVAAVGRGVTEWRPGDEVFGLIRFPPLDHGGMGYAEYTTAPAADLARKPASIDHIHAAAVPMAGLTAYQFLFDHIRLQSGRIVLVNGAGGGVGHFLVQLAKVRDAHVVAVASGRHEAFLRMLGADEFVDYTTTPFDTLTADVDHLVDTVGGPHGDRFPLVVKDGGTISHVFIAEYDRGPAVKRGITFPSGQVHSDGGQLGELARLIDQGRVRVGIDSVFALPDAAKAHERAEQGHIRGKIVLSVTPDQE
ncbi:NADP-dependent oxidoreductase [Yinghuangia aomiensis]|uniref:NADP-dependent oxidoreductase n=1 Tax=Yinghuangia aomiensis TaxID=676205 RepID=A0ABP9HUR8_9ACTN